ncbi:MAG TPA: cytochrome c, partial [Burkholderiaceae bacterium]|nr:cytochrome c [Burkholderiaceae bacterium]
MTRALVRTALALLTIALLLAALIWWLNTRDEEPLTSGGGAAASVAADAEQIARGAYLARAGNCMGCH